MKGEMRGLKFWKNFKYGVKVEFDSPESEKTDMSYVVDVDWENKTTKFMTKKEAAEKQVEIKTFSLETAVELMNGMYCNGYKASIEPLF